MTPTQTDSTPQKSYRPARRPPAYLRTKSGCLTCRKRKKKCDERRNTCGNCARRWIKCVWPSSTPKVVSSNSPVSQEDRELTRLLSEPPDALRSPSAGNSASISPALSHAEPQGELDTPLCLIRGPSIWGLYLGDTSVASSQLFDLLQTKWLRQLIRPLASDSVIELYYHESMAMAMFTPFLMQSLLACCAFEYPAHDVCAQQYFQRLAETLYVQAVAGLRELLESQGHVAPTSAVPRTVLLLCIFERTRPLPSSAVVTHLSGLAQLVLSEAIKATSQEALSPKEQLMRRVILEAFIFHATTSVPFQPLPDQDPSVELALTLAERVLQDLFGNETPEHSDSPVLGFSPRLFLHIREISLLHLKHYEEGNPTRYLELLSSIEAIEKESTAKWTLDPADPLSMDWTVPGICLSVTPYTERYCASNIFLFGPQLYIVSAKILLTDMSQHYNHIPPYDMHELVEEGLRLVNQLQPSVDYYAEYYSWPIHVLGRFVSSRHDRDLLVAKVRGFWEATRCGTMRRLADILTPDVGKPTSCGSQAESISRSIRNCLARGIESG
ncbi:hypothetical protein BJX96DRAFT_142825 [Aspergillus floccosus]